VRLGPIARASLSRADTVYSSSISIVEIRIKSMLGKLTLPDDLVARLRQDGIGELSFSHRDADGLAHFPELARHDPFDRMLIAQAHASGLTLLTADQALLDVARAPTQDARL